MGEATRQCAIIVTELNGGPQDGKLFGSVVRLILLELTLVLRVTGLGTSGAHLNASPTLPELVFGYLVV